jgi:hypothetical protein
MADFSNPSQMSDDELLDALDVLGKRINWVSQNGNPVLLEQLNHLKSLCLQEQRSRLGAGRVEQMKQSSPIVVESDPELARLQRREEEQKADDAKPKRKKEIARRPMLRRSTKPAED